jgi:phosphatidylglycerophosphate synthase
MASPLLDLIMVPVLAFAIFMDALDGWAARRWHEESPAGALLDIAGDRIVELTLWVFFATWLDPAGQPLVPLWVPIAMITRTVLTDFVRSLNFGEGRTPFGATPQQTRGWGYQLTASRWSRAAYGVMKAVCFCGLGVLIALPDLAFGGGSGQLLQIGVTSLAYLTVAFGLIRAVPVLQDGQRYFATQRAPRAARAGSPGLARSRSAAVEPGS